MANIVRRNEGTQPLTPLGTRGWDPFDIMREMLSLDPLRQLGLAQPLMGHLQQFMPHFEVRETGDKYIFRADLPGVKDADLEISLDDNRLTVSGHREMEQANENDRFYAMERAYGSFNRTFTLPVGIDADRVVAKLDNGVLMVEIPKGPEHQPRKISVQPGGEAKKGPKA